MIPRAKSEGFLFEGLAGLPSSPRRASVSSVPLSVNLFERFRMSHDILLGV